VIEAPIGGARREIRAQGAKRIPVGIVVGLNEA
jgi:hypothetical protein